MGNLSEHFNHQDFKCRCRACGGKSEYKIHLGLVGILEELWSKINKPISVKQGYRCEEENEKVKADKRSFHLKGKAAHIYVSGMNLQELYKYVKEIEGIQGIGLNFKENYIHIDTRDTNPMEWVKEGDKYIPLTPDKRSLYGL